MANPTPEISYELAKATRPDCIMATGRSDYPNQVNNVLGFPFIFRGALDVRATEINEAMKIGAVHAIADLAKKTVPDIVNMAYNNANLKFGKDYIIPKPVDPRLISIVAPAVAKAAMESGVAQEPIKDWERYTTELSNRLGSDNTLSKVIETKAKQDIKKIVFSDGEELSVLKAAQIVWEEKIAFPVLLGDVDKIKQIIQENGINLPDTPIINPTLPANEHEQERLNVYYEALYERRQRKGLTQGDARQLVKSRRYYAPMMVEMGDADALISGLSKGYPHVLKPALQVIGVREGVSKIASMHILKTKDGPLFLADTSVNHHLTAEDVANIAELVAHRVKGFNIEPRIAFLTYSNFGSVPNGESAVLMREANNILHQKHPELIADGEMQAHLALNKTHLEELYPFSKLAGKKANVLIFPNLSSANIAYNLLNTVGEMETIGPVLLGLKKPVHISTVRGKCSSNSRYGRDCCY